MNTSSLYIFCKLISAFTTFPQSVFKGKEGINACYYTWRYGRSREHKSDREENHHSSSSTIKVIKPFYKATDINVEIGRSSTTEMVESAGKAIHPTHHDDFWINQQSQYYLGLPRN